MNSQHDGGRPASAAGSPAAGVDSGGVAGVGALADLAGTADIGSTQGARRPLLLGIDGRSGAGKTSVAARLAEALAAGGADVELFHLEDLYPGWHGLAAGIEAYVRDVLTPLRAGDTARWRTWDWTTDSPGAERETRPAAVVLCEGVGAGVPAVRGLLDACLTIEAPAELRKERALARDGETYRPFWDVWAAQEETLPAAADRPGVDLTLDARDPAAPELALSWARRALTTAARR